MATVLKSVKDANNYLSKLYAKHPDGILIIGPAGSGKTTLLKAMKEEYSWIAYDGDKWGRKVTDNGEEKWFISWDKIPEDFQLVAGVPDNIGEFEEAWNIGSMALCLLDVHPLRWISTMGTRGKLEKHAWTDRFISYGNMTPSQAKIALGKMIVEFRNMVPSFGDRIYTIRTDNWEGYGTGTGRAKLD
jgi:GTPase SAR1 family protein